MNMNRFFIFLSPQHDIIRQEYRPVGAPPSFQIAQHVAMRAGFVLGFRALRGGIAKPFHAADDSRLALSQQGFWLPAILYMNLRRESARIKT